MTFSTTRRLIVVSILALVMLALWWLWPRDDAGPQKIVVELPDNVPALPETVTAGTEPVIVWSAQTQGRFEPCGCTAGMHGGLVRRATLLRRLPAERVLSLELGGWSAGNTDYAQIRSRHYLRALAQVGIDAIAIGSDEVALGAAYLKKIIVDVKVPILAANLSFDDNTQRIQKFVRLQVADRELIVTAVVEHQQSVTAGEGIQIGDPVDALQRIVQAAGEVPVVVMADMHEAGLAALARAVPGLAVVVGGNVTTPSPTPQAIGSVRIVHVANHGKTVGWWRMGSPTCAFDLIADELPETPAIRSLVGVYQKDISAATLAIDSPERTLGLVGDKSCQQCHASAGAVHHASRHAHALDSLRAKNYDGDPDCLRCHTTGLGMQDGYARNGSRPQFAHVSCESCHGPGKAHVTSAGREPLRPQSAATCVSCHDAENSPKFSFEEYWQRIKHGR